MAATSIKLPGTLKRRIARIAAAARQTPHAFMVEALIREAERAELRARFGAALASGKAYGLTAAFDYLSARVAGKPARRPRLHRWRASK